MQTVLPHDPVGIQVTRRNWCLDANPIRLAQCRLVGPMRLFWMAGTAGGVSDCVDQDGHNESVRALSRNKYLRPPVPCRKALVLSVMPAGKRRR
jgi:hypothetical protein